MKVLDKMRPVTFNWKTGNDKSLHYGYIAQEVKECLPDFVRE